MFASLPAAQAALDEWVEYYNTQRPHQSLGMATPAERFGAESQPVQPVTVAVTAPVTDRTGDEWVSRRVGANGVVCVAWQQVSVGKHRAGSRCDVHVYGDVLRFWIGPELVKTAARTTTREVRKKRASRPQQRA